MHSGFTGEPVAPFSRSGPMTSRKSYCLLARLYATGGAHVLSGEENSSDSPAAAAQQVFDPLKIEHAELRPGRAHNQCVHAFRRRIG